MKQMLSSLVVHRHCNNSHWHSQDLDLVMIMQQLRSTNLDNAGIRYEDIKSTIRLHCPGNQLIHLMLLADIAFGSSCHYTFMCELRHGSAQHETIRMTGCYVE